MDSYPLGAGFRYSSYGPPYNPGPEYWANVGIQMADKFEGRSSSGDLDFGNHPRSGYICKLPDRHR